VPIRRGDRRMHTVHTAKPTARPILVSATALSERSPDSSDFLSLPEGCADDFKSRERDATERDAISPCGPAGSGNLIITQRYCQDLRGGTTYISDISVASRRRRGGVDNEFGLLCSRTPPPTSEVRGFGSSNAHPVSLPAGSVGGRHSVLTAILAAGLPTGRSRIFSGRDEI
jgi:hypothetical protein